MFFGVFTHFMCDAAGESTVLGHRHVSHEELHPFIKLGL